MGNVVADEVPGRDRGGESGERRSAQDREEERLQKSTELSLPRLRLGWKLLRKKLGFRTLMDVIPLDASLVRGSHGTCPASTDEWPVLIGCGTDREPLPATAVHDRLLAALC